MYVLYSQFLAIVCLHAALLSENPNSSQLASNFCSHFLEALSHISPSTADDEEGNFARRGDGGHDVADASSVPMNSELTHNHFVSPQVNAVHVQDVDKDARMYTALEDWEQDSNDVNEAEVEGLHQNSDLKIAHVGHVWRPESEDSGQSPFRKIESFYAKAFTGSCFVRATKQFSKQYLLFSYLLSPARNLLCHLLGPVH